MKITVRTLQEKLESSVEENMLSFSCGNTTELKLDNPDLLVEKLVEGKTIRLIEDQNETKKKAGFFKEDGEECLLCQNIMGKEESSFSLSSLFKLQENAIRKDGIYTLYLGLDFLKFRKSTTDDSYPLILFPVKLTKEENGYHLSSSRSILPFINPFLSRRLSDLHLVQLPKFDRNLTIEEYLTNLEKLIGNTDSLHLEKRIGITPYHLETYTSYRELSLHQQEAKSNDLIRRYLLGNPGKQENINTIHNPDELHSPFPNYPSMEEALKKALKGQSFAIQDTPGSESPKLISNLILEYALRSKSVLLLSRGKEASEGIRSELGSLKFDDIILSLLPNDEGDQALLSEMLKKKNKGKRNLQPEEKDLDKENQRRLDTYSSKLFEVLPTYRLNPYQVYQRLVELEDIPLIDDPDFNINDYDSRRFRTALSNLQNIKDGMGVFPKKEDSYYFYGFTLPEEKSLKDFALLLQRNKATLKSMETVLDYLNQKERMQDFRLTDMKNLTFFLDRFYSVSAIEPAFFNPSRRKELLSEMNGILPLIAIEEGLKQNISRLAMPEIIQDVNIQKMKSAFDDKPRFFRFLSPDYRKSMQVLNQYALVPLNQDEARELVNLVENYQFNHRKILARLKKIQKLVSKDIRIDENNYRRFVEENLFYQDVYSDLGFLKGMSQDELIRFRKSLPIREIHSIRFDISLQPFFDKKAKNFGKMSLTSLKTLVRSMESELPRLERYLNYRKSLELAKKGHYLGFVTLFFNENEDREKLTKAFEKLYLSKLLDYIYRIAPILEDMSYKEYAKLVTGYQKEQEEEKKEHLEYLKKSIQNNQLDGLDLFDQKELKSWMKEKKTISSLLKQNQPRFMRYRSVFLMSPYDVSSLSFDIRFDLVILLDGTLMDPLLLIPAMQRARQMVVLGDPNFETLVDRKANVLKESMFDLFPELERVRLNHTTIPFDLFSFQSRNFYQKKVISYPSLDSEVEYRPINISTRKKEIDTAREIVSDYLSYQKDHPNESSMILVSDSDLIPSLQNVLEQEEIDSKPIIRTLMESDKTMDSVFLILDCVYEKDETCFDNPDRNQILNRMLSSARRRLFIYDIQHNDNLMNKRRLSPSLSLLKTYLSSLKDGHTLQTLESRMKSEIGSFLDENDIEYRFDYPSYSPIDIMVYYQSKELLAIDLDENKGENRTQTYSRELYRQYRLEEGGFAYLKILPSFYYKEKAAVNKAILSKIQALIKQAKKKQCR